MIGVPDGRGSESIQAFIVLDKSRHPLPTAQDLARFADSNLSKRKIPEFWTFVDELPLAGSGKIDRKALMPLVERFRTSTFHIDFN